jgi:uncharacterized protein
MNESIRKKVIILKKRYEKEGFILLGIFGSYARDEEKSRSDLDLLYELDDKFYSKYIGWESCYRLQMIKSEIESEFQMNVDLANRNALNKTGIKNILTGVLYVT